MRSSKKPPGLFGNAPALHQPTGKGNYQTYTWLEYTARSRGDRLRLAPVGHRKGRHGGAAFRDPRRILSRRSWRSHEWFHRSGALHHVSVSRSSEKRESQPRQGASSWKIPKSMQALVMLPMRPGATAHRIALDFADRRSRGRPHVGATASEGPGRAEEGPASIREDPRGGARRTIPRFCISPPAPPANRKWAW